MRWVYAVMGRRDARHRWRRRLLPHGPAPDWIAVALLGGILVALWWAALDTSAR